MKKSLVIAIDFDGTIVGHAFPKIAPPEPYAFEVIKALKEAGHKLILWTAREDNVPKKQQYCYLTDAVKFLKENGIVFDAVNETYLNTDWRSELSLKRKPHCDLFIDDRNFGGFPGWEVVGRNLLGDLAMDLIISNKK